MLLLPLLLTLASDPVVAPEQSMLPSVDMMEYRRLCELDGLQQAVSPRVATRLQPLAGPQQPVVVRPQDPSVRSVDLMYREGDPVRLDLLLERRIDGCAAPLYRDVSGFEPEAD